MLTPEQYERVKSRACKSIKTSMDDYEARQPAMSKEKQLISLYYIIKHLLSFADIYSAESLAQVTVNKIIELRDKTDKLESLLPEAIEILNDIKSRNNNLPNKRPMEQETPDPEPSSKRQRTDTPYNLRELV